MGNEWACTEIASTGDVRVFVYVTVKEITLCSFQPSPGLSAAPYRQRWSRQGKYVIKDAAYLGCALIASALDKVPVCLVLCEAKLNPP